MDYSIQGLKEAFQSLEWEDRKYQVHIRLIKNMEARIKEEMIQIYPKNLFINDEEITFYTFTDKHIFITKVDDDSDKLTQNKIMKIKDIEKLEIVEGNEYEPMTLKMYFYNGEEHIFNSGTDTNEPHMRSFNKTIKEIVILLLRA